jgi:hypothetical protein
LHLPKAFRKINSYNTNERIIHLITYDRHVRRIPTRG